MAMRSKVWFRGRLLAGIAILIPIGNMNICLLWVLCVVSLRSVRGLISLSEFYRVWCVWVWLWSLGNEETLAHWGAVAPLGEKITCYGFFEAVINGSLSPHHAVSSGCGWRNGLQIRRAAANILNKQSRTAEKGWPFRLVVGRGVNSSSPWKRMTLRNISQCHVWKI